MPNFTEYLRLKKPIKDKDTADIDVLNENADVIDAEFKKQNNSLNSKEPAFSKKTGFNLDKTDLTENNSNKLFTAKGALNLLNNLTSKFTEGINSAKTTLRSEMLNIKNSLTTLINGKLDKTGGNVSGNIVINENKALRIVTNQSEQWGEWAVGYDTSSNTFSCGLLTKPFTTFSNTNPRARIGTNYYDYYHTGNKPSAEDVGALPSTTTLTDLKGLYNDRNQTLNGSLTTRKNLRVDWGEGINADPALELYGSIDRVLVSIGYSRSARAGEKVRLYSNNSVGLDGQEGYLVTSGIRRRMSSFTSAGDGTVSGNTTAGSYIPLFKDPIRNDLNIVFSNADNSLTISESGRYRITIQLYITILGDTAYNGKTIAKLLKNSDEIRYMEFTSARNASTNISYVDLAAGDKIRFFTKRVSPSADIVYYQGSKYNLLTIEKLG